LASSDRRVPTGSVYHRLPEQLAVRLAENLRAWPIEEGSRSVADKIELFLVGETLEPIDLSENPDERRAVRQMLDVLMAVPENNTPEMREFLNALGSSRDRAAPRQVKRERVDADRLGPAGDEGGGIPRRQPWAYASLRYARQRHLIRDEMGRFH